MYLPGNIVPKVSYQQQDGTVSLRKIKSPFHSRSKVINRIQRRESQDYRVIMRGDTKKRPQGSDRFTSQIRFYPVKPGNDDFVSTSFSQ